MDLALHNEISLVKYDDLLDPIGESMEKVELDQGNNGPVHFASLHAVQE